MAKWKIWSPTFAPHIIFVHKLKFVTYLFLNFNFCIKTAILLMFMFVLTSNRNMLPRKNKSK